MTAVGWSATALVAGFVLASVPGFMWAAGSPWSTTLALVVALRFGLPALACDLGWMALLKAAQEWAENDR